jgi:threonine aldolase
MEAKLKNIPEVKISRPVETNGVFAIMDKRITEKLMEKHFFYIWDDETGEVRWMCSWNTQKDDIDKFINDLTALL